MGRGVEWGAAPECTAIAARAQAAVPQARVGPTPRSQTRAWSVLFSCVAKVTLVPSGKTEWVAIKGAISSKERIEGGLRTIACGLPSDVVSRWMGVLSMLIVVDCGGE